MTQTRRLKQLHEAISFAERRRARKLAACEQRLAECESRLTDLENHQKHYERHFAIRARQAIHSTELRDYQTFLARLAEAIRQQTQLLARARAEHDAERALWQSAARRVRTIEKLIEQRQARDRRSQTRRDQRESDERAQRSASNALALPDP